MLFRSLALLDRLDEPPRPGRDGSLAEVAASEFRRLRKAVRALPPEPADEELHASRIKTKRARYAAELVEGKAAAAFVARAKELQDVVGEHQDAAVASGRIADLARRLGDPGTALAAGRLLERGHARRRAARAAFPGAWKRLERAGKRAWG